MNVNAFSHLVEINEDDRRVTIYRIFTDGRKDLFTQIDLPSKSADEDAHGFENFSRLLGENLLLDSPVARRLLSL